MNRITSLYPEAESLLPSEDVVAVEDFLRGKSREGLKDWANDPSRLVVHELGGQAYRMVVDRPDDASDRTIVVPGEFANGLHGTAIARAMVIREMVDPSATLVMQPSSSFDEDNMNFSSEERNRLRGGDSSPMVDRLRATLEHHDVDSDVVLYGPSQGAVLASGYAAHPDTQITAMSLVEAPHAEKKTLPRTAYDFLVSGSQLGKNVRLNYPQYATPEEWPLTSNQSQGLRSELIAFAQGAFRADNLALLALFRHGKLRRDMDFLSHKDRTVGITVANGGRSKVSSSLVTNDVLRQFPNSESFTFEGKLADHSITNVYALNGSLARRALQLSQ
jgi:pimeloyl-ACP methyl ester carboxylesterase